MLQNTIVLEQLSVKSLTGYLSLDMLLTFVAAAGDAAMILCSCFRMLQLVIAKSV